MKFSLLGPNIIPNVLMVFVGAIFLIPSTVKIYAYGQFYIRSVSVYGIVDKMPLGGGSGFGGRPLVQYQDLQGNAHVIKSKVKTHFFLAPRKGEKIKVLFLEKDPQTAMVDSLFHYFILPLVFMGIGISLVFLAVKRGWSSLNDSG